MDELAVAGGDWHCTQLLRLCRLLSSPAWWRWAVAFQRGKTEVRYAKEEFQEVKISALHENTEDLMAYSILTEKALTNASGGSSACRSLVGNQSEAVVMHSPALLQIRQFRSYVVLSFMNKTSVSVRPKMSPSITAFPLPSPQISHHCFLKQSSYSVFLVWMLPTARSSVCHVI